MKMKKLTKNNLILYVTVKLIGCTLAYSTTTTANTTQAILENYADIAEASYSDSLTTAVTMRAVIQSLIKNPTKKTLKDARAAWKAARVPYMQTEVYRFGNVIVDQWEGKVNAWPLDEGLIDYVDTTSYGHESDENESYSANVIANSELIFSGQQVDAAKITKSLLQDSLHEADGNEANVATGYHAIEFLLWGQDLNGTGAGAGNRQASDFDVGNCTNGNCERRIEYLSTVADLLIDDLQWMVDQWKENGDARTFLLNSSSSGLSTVFSGMGSLSYGELAGERMKLGLILHDPEEEHDCFSDNTHNSHFYNAKGIQNVFLGAYTRTDGSIVSGPSIKTLLEENSAENIAEQLGDRLDETMLAMKALVDSANDGESYDQMLGEDNESGNTKIQNAIDSLINQTRLIEKAVYTLGLDSIEFEGSDSLDNPNDV